MINVGAPPPGPTDLSRHSMLHILNHSDTQLQYHGPERAITRGRHPAFRRRDMGFTPWDFERPARNQNQVDLSHAHSSCFPPTIYIVFTVCFRYLCLTLLFQAPGHVTYIFDGSHHNRAIRVCYFPPPHFCYPQSSPVMPMHISPSIDTDLSRIETVSTPSSVLISCPY